MKKLLNGFVKRIDALVAVAGISLITAGACLYSVRAGLLTAGVLLLIDVYMPRNIKGKKK